MFQRQLLILALIISVEIVNVANAAGQASLSAREQKVVDLAVARQMERQKAVGVAVGVIRDGKSGLPQGLRI